MQTFAACHLALPGGIVLLHDGADHVALGVEGGLYDLPYAVVMS